MKRMKANGSRPSLSLLKSTLYNSILELGEVCAAIGVDRKVSVTEFLEVSAKLEWISLAFQALKDLVHQRKQAIPKGKLYMCFKFPTLIRIWMIESELEVIQGPIASLADKYMKLGRTLQPELFPDTSRCSNNRTSPEMAMVLFPRPTEEIRLNNKEPLMEYAHTVKNLYYSVTDYWALKEYAHAVKKRVSAIQKMRKHIDVARLTADLNLMKEQEAELARLYAIVNPQPEEEPMRDESSKTDNSSGRVFLG